MTTAVITAFWRLLYFYDRNKQTKYCKCQIWRQSIDMNCSYGVLFIKTLKRKTLKISRQLTFKSITTSYGGLQWLHCETGFWSISDCLPRYQTDRGTDGQTYGYFEKMHLLTVLLITTLALAKRIGSIKLLFFFWNIHFLPR